MIRYPPPASFAADAPSAITTFAPASSIWYLASCPVRAGLTGVTAAPSRQAANMPVISSTRFGSMTASTPPRRSPASASRAATADTVWAKRALSSSWRSSAMQAPVGSSAARWSGMAAASMAVPSVPCGFCAVPTLRSASPAGIGRMSPNQRRRWYRAYILAADGLAIGLLVRGGHGLSYPRHDVAVPPPLLACRHGERRGCPMTRLINIDNGGTLTDFCLVDGGDVRYTKTLTTPYDLSRCLFDGLTRVSELVYGEPQLAALLQSTDYIRYST